MENTKIGDVEPKAKDTKGSTSTDVVKRENSLKNNSTDVLQQKTESIAKINNTAISDRTIDTLMQRAEMMHKVLEACVRCTNHVDWLDMGGKPYLESTGCYKVARLVGLAINNMVLEKMEEGGGHYTYMYQGNVSISTDSNNSVDVVGGRSTLDNFFSRAGGKSKSADQINKSHVQKAAHTNLIVRAVHQYIGLRSMTWEVLAKMGIQREKCKKVEYNRR